MSMNVNPKDFSAKADSTKVVIKTDHIEQGDSVWNKNKAKSKKAPQHNTQQLGKAQGFARTALNALTNYFLPQGSPGFGEMLFPTEEEILEDISNRIRCGQKVTQEEQALYNKHYGRA